MITALNPERIVEFNSRDPAEPARILSCSVYEDGYDSSGLKVTGPVVVMEMEHGDKHIAMQFPLGMFRSNLEVWGAVIRNTPLIGCAPRERWMLEEQAP